MILTTASDDYSCSFCSTMQICLARLSLLHHSDFRTSISKHIYTILKNTLRIRRSFLYTLWCTHFQSDLLINTFLNVSWLFVFNFIPWKKIRLIFLNTMMHNTQYLLIYTLVCCIVIMGIYIRRERMDRLGGKRWR